MKAIIPTLRYSAKERLLKNLRRCGDAKLRIRDLIAANLIHQRTPEHIANNSMNFPTAAVPARPTDTVLSGFALSRS